MVPEGPPGWRGEIDACGKFDVAAEGMRQRLELRLHCFAVDQHNELLAAVIPGHARGQRRRQKRGHPPGLGLGCYRSAADDGAPLERDLQQKEARQFARIDVHPRAVGDEIHRIIRLRHRVVTRVKSFRVAVGRHQEMRTEDATDRFARSIRRSRIDRRKARKGYSVEMHRHSQSMACLPLAASAFLSVLVAGSGQSLARSGLRAEGARRIISLLYV